MGYRKYAADYEIEYVERLGQRRAKAVRIYVGPYFVLRLGGDELRRLRLFYIIMIALSATLLTLPMCIDCVSTRTLYVQLPAAAVWLPWAFAASSVWYLCTAGEKLEREQNDALHNRMSPATLAMLILSAVAFVGSVACVLRKSASGADVLVAFCNLGLCLVSALMFSCRGKLLTDEVENPEKPRAKKK